MAVDPARAGASRPGLFRRLTTETKQAFKTTEFWTLVVVAIAILIAANAIEIAEGGTDYFTSDKAWLYVTILAAAYMISRGLAKSGVRDPYWDQPNAGSDEDGLGNRVKAAAQVLTQGEGATQADGQQQPVGSGTTNRLQ